MALAVMMVMVVAAMVGVQEYTILIFAPFPRCWPLSNLPKWQKEMTFIQEKRLPEKKRKMVDT